MPSLPVDTLSLAATPPASNTPPSDAGGTGENAQSFQATLTKEIQKQDPDAKDEPVAAKKHEERTATDPGQPADPAQADLLISGLIKPQLVPAAEAASPRNDPSGLGADSVTGTGASAIDLVDAAKAQAMLAEQIQARSPAGTDAEMKADDTARLAVENGVRSKIGLSLKRDTNSGEDPAKPRAGGFRQGLDHALQQVAANKSEQPVPASPGVNGNAAIDSASSSPASRPGSEAMSFAKAAGQANAQKHATADAAELQSKDLSKTLDDLKHDPVPGPSADLRAAFNAQVAAAQSPSNPSPSGLRIDARIGTEAWGSALGQQVIVMVAGQQQQAEIHLNPESLGPVKVTITLDNNQASLSFVAREVSVRDAIESSLPRLTSMMSESGITLGQTNVTADSSGNPTPWSQPETFANNRQNSDASGVASALPGTSPRTRVQQGLIDTFA